MIKKIKAKNIAIENTEKLIKDVEEMSKEKKKELMDLKENLRLLKSLGNLDSKKEYLIKLKKDLKKIKK